MAERKLKIVYILASTNARGGVKIQIEHANLLSGLGHDVSIISSCPSPDWINISVPWIQQDIPQGSILGCDTPKCDIAVFSYYEQAFTMQQAAMKQDFIPLYFAQGDEAIFGNPEQEDNPQQRNNILAAQNSVRLAYPLLTVSHSAAARLKALGGGEARVIHNGVDTSVFRPGEKASSPPLRILSIGSELPRFKGIDGLYAALIKLKQEPDTPDFTFVRASPQPNRFAQLPLETEFHLNPSQEELAKLYASAHLFIGPSKNESFYLPPLEAMACGTAVVCSDLPSVREYARPGEDFLAFTPGNIGEMYLRIQTLLSSESLRNKLEERGKKVAGSLAWDQITQKLISYFLELLQNKNQIMENIRQDLANPPFSFKLGKLKK